MKTSDRLINLLQEFTEKFHGGNKARAARALGVSPVTFGQWLNKTRTPNLVALDSIFETLGIKIVMPDVELMNYELIPKVVARPGAGNSLITSGETKSYYVFRSDFLRKERIPVEQAVLMDVIGDSMEPLISETDTLLVNQADKELRDGKIYVVTLGDELMVKRIHKSVKGLILRSENPRYPDVRVEGVDLEQFIVHGRVRWCGKIL